MRGRMIVVVALLLLLGTACQPEVDMDKTQTEVKSVLDRYVESVQNEDMATYAQVVAQDAAMVNFGAFGDPIVGWEALREVMEGQNAALESIRIEQSDVAVHVLPSGNEAWATSLWRFTADAGEATLDLPVRCTWQLQRRDGVWWVVHFHKSIAAG